MCLRCLQMFLSPYLCVSAGRGMAKIDLVKQVHFSCTIIIAKGGRVLDRCITYANQEHVCGPVRFTWVELPNAPIEK